MRSTSLSRRCGQFAHHLKLQEAFVASLVTRPPTDSRLEGLEKNFAKLLGGVPRQRQHNLSSPQ
ncbi:hypothetical protein L484_005850 [Morus notabilis]|uniref:Uncharacterized protein n=1 Tax=Morus notabilis TaxID=981085 RepID=W9QFC9_9ROSA|nr:hypothetical protein L484_005850 [Morus notabilis]